MLHTLILKFIKKVYIITITSLCNILRFFTAVNNDKFQMKIFDIFFIFAQNIDLWYTVLMSTYNLCLRAKKRKTLYPYKPQFYYIEVGCKGVYITQTCYPNVKIGLDLCVYCLVTLLHSVHAINIF